jgi:hypothetical protein
MDDFIDKDVKDSRHLGMFLNGNVIIFFYCF